MKKILLFLFCVFLFSCDDGDIQIETIDFNSIDTINNCDTTTANTVNVLFKINGSEALVLELEAAALSNEVTESNFISNISTSGPSKLTYRTFSDAVSTNYFCASIPTTDLTVLEEVIAQSGTATITTETEDNITFTHTIILEKITLETSKGERITDISITNFGEITTTNN